MMTGTDLLDFVKRCLSYDPDTGLFTWVSLPSNNSGKIGSRAGRFCRQGYVGIGIRGKKYQAHRLAWLVSYGLPMPDKIDHINGVKDDNRLCNLRATTDRMNVENFRRANINNKSGYLGVYYRGKRWFSCIKSYGKQLHLGSFDTPEEAHIAYVTAKRKLHQGCTI